MVGILRRSPVYGVIHSHTLDANSRKVIGAAIKDAININFIIHNMFANRRYTNVKRDLISRLRARFHHFTYWKLLHGTVSLSSRILQSLSCACRLFRVRATIVLDGH
ncbi:c18.1 [Ichnoviriform fugitivi]|uniref:C18.1 n=1 Tax=Ichnoviriform fugitivi TaxID=265522 RepID=A2Q0I3_9VIRU|nr:c18.1 [Ichnoviriform fugitivi]BAF45698.1 c18.1 [Ichnoviriform fugitivi]